MPNQPNDTGPAASIGSHETVLMPAVAFPCASCGGHGAWHGGRQDVMCASCGKALDLPPPQTGGVDWFGLAQQLRDRANSGRTWQPVATSVSCLACHAVTRLRAGVAAGRCDSCGAASLVVIEQSGAPITPTGVVPFRLSESDARDAVRAWVAEHARLDFGRGRSGPIELRAAYMPWWDFFAHVHCPWRMEANNRSRDGTVTRIVKTGTIELDLEEALPGVRSAHEAMLVRAGPFDFASARPYDARYLAGATAEHYSVNLWDGWDAAHARMQARLERALRADADTWVTLPDETWPSWTRESARMILVPVFVGSFGTGARSLPLIVNGASGKVAGQWPWSLAALVRSAAVLAALAAAAASLVWGAWTLLKALGFRPLW